MLDKLQIKSSTNYYCKECNYSTNKKSDYNKHIITGKHCLLTLTNEPVHTFPCDKCNKKYSSRVGLWSHKKKCLNENKIEKKMKN